MYRHHSAPLCHASYLYAYHDSTPSRPSQTITEDPEDVQLLSAAFSRTQDLLQCLSSASAPHLSSLSSLSTSRKTLASSFDSLAHTRGGPVARATSGIFASLRAADEARERCDALASSVSSALSSTSSATRAAAARGSLQALEAARADLDAELRRPPPASGGEAFKRLEGKRRGYQEAVAKVTTTNPRP